MLTRKPILVVDDTDIMRQGTVIALRMFGYETDEAANGQEALFKVKNGVFSLIFMDYNMKDMLGTECTSKIRLFEQESGLERTPIVGMTASAELDIRKLCLLSGMDDYVDKACSIDDLQAKAKQWTHNAETFPIKWPTVHAEDK